MLNLAEYRSRPKLLADRLPWACLVAPGVVLNKDGSFQRSARFRGPDLESATEAELVATCARINNVLRRFGSGWAPFFEAERHAARDYPPADFPDPVSRLVDEERRAAFEQVVALFESRYVLTFVQLPPPETIGRAELLLIEGAEGSLAAVIIIVITSLSPAFGEASGGFRRLIQIVFGLSIAFAATSFFLSFFSFAGGALIT